MAQWEGWAWIKHAPHPLAPLLCSEVRPCVGFYMLWNQTDMVANSGSSRYDLGKLSPHACVSFYVKLGKIKITPGPPQIQ